MSFRFAFLLAVLVPVRPALALDFHYVQNANGQPYSYVIVTPAGPVPQSANWPVNNNWNQEQQTFIDGVGETIIYEPSNWSAQPHVLNSPSAYYPGSPNDPDPPGSHHVYLDSFTVTGNVSTTISTLNLSSGSTLNMVGGTSLTMNVALNMNSASIPSTLNMVGGTSVTIMGDNPAIRSLDISSGSILNMVGSTSLTIVRGDINNDGTINLQSNSMTGAALKIADVTTLNGSGRVMLGGRVDNRIYGVSGSEELVNGLDLAGFDKHTISGGGQLGMNSLKLTNQGLIDGNIAGTTLYINPNASGVTNSGTIRASEGGIVRLQDGTFIDTGVLALIQALDGSQVELEGATIVGGTLSSSGSGKIVVPNGTFGGLTGVITNNGLVSLESSSITGADLKIADGTTLNGSGRVVLGGRVDNRIYGVSGSEELVNGATHTISGGGQLGMNSLKLTNQGLIDGNIAGTTVYINPNASGVTNSGTIRASEGGIIRLQDGTFINTGGLIQALDGSQVELEGATIVGGTLSSSGSGKIVVPNGTFGGLTGVITNNGLVYLESSSMTGADLKIADGTTLNGSGRVVLGGHVNNRIYGVATGSEELVNGAAHTISGGGQLGTNLLKLTNQGLIDANLAGTVLIVNPNAAGVVNHTTGILRASGSAELQLTDGTFDNQGTVEALNGSSVTYSTSAITANNVAGVLTGGTWCSVATGGGATVTLRGTNNITQIASGTEVVLSGVGSSLRLASTVIESTLTTNNGTLRILDGRAFTMTNTLHNAGTVELGGSGLADAILSTSTLTNSGTLQGHGTIVGNILNSSGTVSPGSSPGTLHVTGDYSQSAAATLQIELASALSFDKLDVTGSMTPGGTLQVTLVGFLPDLGNSFDILEWATLNGTFTTIQLPSLADGLIWDTTQLYTAGVLTVASVPEPQTLSLVALALPLLLPVLRRRRAS